MELAAPQLAMLETAARLAKMLEPYEVALQGCFSSFLHSPNDCLRYNQGHFQFVVDDLRDPVHFDNYFDMTRHRLGKKQGEACKEVTFLRAVKTEEMSKYLSHPNQTPEHARTVSWLLRWTCDTDWYLKQEEKSSNIPLKLGFDLDKKSGHIKSIYQDRLDSGIIYPKMPSGLQERSTFFDDSDLCFQFGSDWFAVQRRGYWKVLLDNSWYTYSDYFPYQLYLGNDDRIRAGHKEEKYQTVEEEIQDLLSCMPFRPESASTTLVEKG